MDYPHQRHLDLSGGGGAPSVLSVDERALLYMERLQARQSGEPYGSYHTLLMGFAADRNATINDNTLFRDERFLMVLYALTATDRLDKKRQCFLSEEDRELGLTVPSAFGQTLSPDPVWKIGIMEQMVGLLRDAGYMTLTPPKPAAAGNATDTGTIEPNEKTPPAPSTGSEEPSTPSPSGSETASSGDPTPTSQPD